MWVRDRHTLTTCLLKIVKRVKPYVVDLCCFLPGCPLYTCTSGTQSYMLIQMHCKACPVVILGVYCLTLLSPTWLSLSPDI